MNELDDEERALRSVAMQNAAAILVARQRVEQELTIAKESLERKTAELAETVANLQEETRALELLNETGAILATKLDMDVLVKAVSDAATRLSGARFGAFFYSKSGQHEDAFGSVAMSGESCDSFERFGKLHAAAIFGANDNGDAAIRFDNIAQDSQYAKFFSSGEKDIEHFPIRSFLATPIRSRFGTIFGGLFFGHPEAGVFTERIGRLMTGIATQAAVAIDNARLYEDVNSAGKERGRLLVSERRAREEAERANAAKDDFLATLSHELRTPLNAILGWAEMLRRRFGSDPDLHRGLETIERNARAQAQLIDDLLDVNRITSGKVRLDLQRLQPSVFIDAAIETVRPAAQVKGIRIERLLDPSIGPIHGDPARLEQVMWNLLSNAIKFTRRDGKVQVLLEQVDSNLEISVTDTGVGIAAEFLPYVFDRFRQADGSTARRHGGLGLGLAIAKTLVELHGGTLSVKSPGMYLGSTFSLRLPVSAISSFSDAVSRVRAARSEKRPPEFNPIDLSGIDVLVVDDEADARDLIERILAECKSNVYTAASAAEAMSLIEVKRPHIIISDIGMPDIDGFELLRMIRALGAAQGGKMPAIALTAFARAEDRTKVLRAGFLAHVAKPVESSELIATVASVMGRAEPH